MRYILYFFTLALVFTSGMLVGNFYLPAHNASVAAAVSVPDLESFNPELNTATLEHTQLNLQTLTQALSACPVVVEAEKEHLFKQITLFLALQDFKIKKAVYEAEIAKNTQGTPTTSQFSRAATDYATAKAYTEKLADELFPPQIPEQTSGPDGQTISSDIEKVPAAKQAPAPTGTAARQAQNGKS